MKRWLELRGVLNLLQLFECFNVNGGACKGDRLTNNRTVVSGVRVLLGSCSWGLHKRQGREPTDASSAHQWPSWLPSTQPQHPITRFNARSPHSYTEHFIYFLYFILGISFGQEIYYPKSLTRLANRYWSNVITKSRTNKRHYCSIIRFSLFLFNIVV